MIHLSLVGAPASVCLWRRPCNLTLPALQAHNLLTGSLPSMANMTSLAILMVPNNHFSGHLPEVGFQQLHPDLSTRPHVARLMLLAQDWLYPPKLSVVDITNNR